MSQSLFFKKSILIIKNIPKGKVLTYGGVAKLAGVEGGARQVSFFLSSSSRKYSLPWHRVISSKGTISLPHGKGYDTQISLLEKD
ncbi:MAG: MGMT family protein [Bdellovibrionales bacterium]